MIIDVHHSVTDLFEADLMCPKADSWPCLHFYTDIGLVEVVWVTAPCHDWLVSRDFLRLRVPAGIGARAFRDALKPRRPLADALCKVGDLIETNDSDLFAACDATASCLLKLGSR
jgi:hypothetical protein